MEQEVCAAFSLHPQLPQFKLTAEAPPHGRRFRTLTQWRSRSHDSFADSNTIMAGNLA